MFLEIGVKAKNFSVMFDPRRLNPWDRLVLRRFPFFLETEIIDALSELIDEVHIDIFLNILALLLLAVIGIGKLLSLVEILFVGVIEYVAW